MSRILNILLAGGGTGGHLFPGLALAAELQKQNEQLNIIFATGGKELEQRILAGSGFTTKAIGTKAWRPGPLRLPLMLISMGFSSLRSFIYMLTHRVRAVVGLGGYASFGPVMAGFLLRKKIYLLEQNAVPGKANRLFARFARKVFIQFETSASCFPAGRAELLGNPIRPEIQALAESKSSSEAPVVLVAGGSQGALALNEMFIQAAARINWPNGSRVIHLCGADHYDHCRGLYDAGEIKAEIDLRGFEDDMASVYRETTLCLCRSGATSIAELTCAGIPLVMVPYPHAADDHQFANAKDIEGRGAGICHRQEDLDSDKLADLLNELLNDKERLQAMTAAATETGQPEAGKRIAEYILSKIGA